MYGVIGEGVSDVETLKVLIRRMAGDDRLSITTYDSEGAGKLLKECCRVLKLMASRGCRKFVVCWDADGTDPEPRKRELEKVVATSGVSQSCVVIPVQELESWILADLQVAQNIITGWHPNDVPYPESIASPKEYLRAKSAASNGKPRYRHVTDNKRIAKLLSLEKLRKKCPSFRPLYDFVVAA